jgi:hypothetical protein
MLPSFACVDDAAHHDSQYMNVLCAAMKDGDVLLADKAGGMSKETGTVGWLPLWCEGKTAAVQCDFSVFLGNEMWREFVLPGVEQEVDYLDHCFYHLDGRQSYHKSPENGVWLRRHSRASRPRAGWGLYGDR